MAKIYRQYNITFSFSYHINIYSNLHLFIQGEHWNESIKEGGNTTLARYETSKNLSCEVGTGALRCAVEASSSPEVQLAASIHMQPVTLIIGNSLAEW